MLVLSRKVGESIQIDGRVTVTIFKINAGRVRVGIEAPPEVPIMRSELSEWSELSFDESAPEISGNAQDSSVVFSD